MSPDDGQQRESDSFIPSMVETDSDVYDDEEVPTVVLVVVASIAVLTAVLYLSLGGGHNHFH